MEKIKTNTHHKFKGTSRICCTLKNPTIVSYARFNKDSVVNVKFETVTSNTVTKSLNKYNINLANEALNCRLRIAYRNEELKVDKNNL